MSFNDELKFWFSVFGLHLENMLIINFSFIRVAEGTLVQLIGCFRFRWYRPNTFRYLVLLEVVVKNCVTVCFSKNEKEEKVKTGHSCLLLNYCEKRFQNTFQKIVIQQIE